MIFAELKVFEVINIFFIFFLFSSFSIKGIMLRISPTLDPWNHIKLLLVFFLLNLPIFSKNLFGSSFFLYIL